MASYDSAACPMLDKAACVFIILEGENLDSAAHQSLIGGRYEKPLWRLRQAKVPLWVEGLVWIRAFFTSSRGYTVASMDSTAPYFSETYASASVQCVLFC
jgi:hypothetical protein